MMNYIQLPTQHVYVVIFVISKEGYNDPKIMIPIKLANYVALVEVSVPGENQ